MEKLKTGTTTLGLICNDGVVVAAEKKSTMGFMVSSKVCRKIFKLDEHIGMTVAGEVGDAQALERLLKAQFKLYKLERGPITVKAAATLLSNILQGSKYFPYLNLLILAGYDDRGPQLYTFDPFGAFDVNDKFYCTGSGSPYAYGVLEAQFNENIDIKDGIKLAISAIKAAIERDIASGGKGFTVAIITKEGYKELTDQELKTYL